MSAGKLTLERPVPDDARRIHALQREAAPHCIPQPVDEIRSRLDEFQVARDPERGVLASVAVRPLGELRAEVRGVVVDRRLRGSGLGSALVRWAIRRAVAEGRQLVCVTRSPAFFESLGFREIPLSWIPEKPARPPGGPDLPARVAMAWDPEPARAGQQEQVRHV